jgi:hypothetical protein
MRRPRQLVRRTMRLGRVVVLGLGSRADGGGC